MSNVPVIVTEEDKAATAALLGYHDWADANDYRLTGRQDRTVEATVQAFARHRIAATSTLQDQVEAYREALEPFAKLGAILEPRNPDSDFFVYRPAIGDEYALHGDHLRAAAAALTKKDKADV